MRLLRDLPIKHKLMIITVVTSGVALLVACSAFALYERAAFRRAMARDFGVIADIIDGHVASGLAANDPAAITQTLATLRAQPCIIGACVYTRNGAVVAQYRRADDGDRFEFPAPEPTGHWFRSDRLDTFKTIGLAGASIGVVYLGSDLRELHDRAWRCFTIIAALLLACSLMALVLAARLQRIISEPIVDLAQTVATVAAGQNYSLRANQRSDDELGRLVDGFNQMLAQIQARDAALQAAHDHLEKRVEERTAELRNENTERKLAEEELRAKSALLEAQMDSSIDGIIVVDNAGKKVFQNQRTADLWRIPPHIVADNDDEKQIQFVVNRTKYPERFVEKVHYLYAHPNESSQDEVEFKDGLVLDRYSAPIVGKDGKHYGRIWTFRDITERKRSEADLAKAHRELLEISRQAGMAEVATSVLHNVGNVLNSVNVSATLVMEWMRGSKATNLPKLGSMLQERAADLADFLSNDPKGRIIPAFLISVAEQLANERTMVLDELGHLRKNIEHIKEIVAMQQSYAKVSGVTEPIKIAELVEDALRLNAGARARHGLEVVRDFQVQPTVTTERHKVMQVLVNLIQNAEQACRDTSRADMRMTVRITRTTGRLHITVVDNGVGVPPENLTRIFNHGFTTRRDGHGFALHSGALVAHELGGSLTVQSEGVGRGTAFTLELPLPDGALA